MHTVTDFPRRVRCIEHVTLPGSDGTRLAARIWLPEDAETAPVPGILEYIPYRKRDLTRERDEITHRWLAGQGYACVRLDIRGSGESGGVMTDQYRQEEMDDGVAAIEWMAEQPWCDGNVGMMGISWGGFNALQVAANRPSALKAIVTVCSTDDLYRDNMHYMGGCLLSDNLSEATTMFSVNTCPPDPALVGERWREMWMDRLRGSGLWLDTWLAHQRRDDYWKHGSVCEDYDAVTCPVMAVGGWADGYTNAVFRLLEGLNVPRLGLVGPWGHKYPHLGKPGPAIGFLQEMKRWWDHWLKGAATSIMDEPMLRAWMQDWMPPGTSYAERPGRWIGESVWPSERVQERRMPLAPGRLRFADTGDDRHDGEPPAQVIRSPLSVGLFAGKWASYTYAPDLPYDQREEDGGALVYESPPLEEATDILGRPEVELEVSADRPVAMVAARLSDVAPDGRATRVSYGLLNLTHRDGNEHPAPLESGERYRVRVRLNAIGHRFPEGHRMRLSLSSSYFPLAWTPPEPTTLTVYPLTSALLLPERSAAGKDGAITFEAPEGAPPAMRETVEAPHHNWLVHRDLANEESTLEIIKDEGVWRLPDADVEITDRTWDWYTVRAEDVSTARGETRTERRFRRAGWDVLTRTRTVLTCDATHFTIHASLDAFEGEERVFSENWKRRLPRDLV
ncbi:CocE/NonD family hydrolase [Caenispirillum salinarum]|uniref:CocE/NonD family hydrolase n=1 Tax=Caenispirillum salinarum TaxID=859058 RepID=UPI00384D7510